MNPISYSIAHRLALAGSLACLSIPAFAQDDEVRTARVTFEAGRDNAVIPGKIKGYESVVYQVNAKEGQFLSVSLRPDSRFAGYNVYIPGRGPGDEALYNSDLGGGLEYTGQLYKTGDHQISVFLNRAAARRGEVANYDLVIRITDEPAGPMPAELPARAGASAEGDSPATESTKARAVRDPVAMARGDHGRLLGRQAALPEGLAKRPVSIALLVLEPDLIGLVAGVEAHYDMMEEPSEVEVTIDEGGILDDDLMGVRHSITLDRTSNDEWRVTEYARGELRRSSGR